MSWAWRTVRQFGVSFIACVLALRWNDPSSTLDPMGRRKCYLLVSNVLSALRKSQKPRATTPAEDLKRCSPVVNTNVPRTNGLIKPKSTACVWALVFGPRYRLDWIRITLTTAFPCVSI